MYTSNKVNQEPLLEFLYLSTEFFVSICTIIPLTLIYRRNHR